MRARVSTLSVWRSDWGAVRTWEPRHYSYEPAGQLALRLTNVDAPGVRSKWQETQKQRLEEMLPEFASYLTTAALSFKLQRKLEEQRAAEAREAEIRRYKEQQRRWEEEDRQRKEAKREEALEAEVARWRRAQDIRDYVRAALAALDEGDVAIDDEQSVRDRLSWALEYADRIDPLTSNRADRS